MEAHNNEIVYSQTRPKLELHTAILCTCKDLRDHGLFFLYRYNTFSIWYRVLEESWYMNGSSTISDSWFDCMGSANAIRMSSLCLRVTLGPAVSSTTGYRVWRNESKGFDKRVA